MNSESSDLKPYPISLCTHNVWICSWWQTKCYHYNKLEKTDTYVPSGDSHRNGALYSNRTIAPRGYNTVGLVGCKLQGLFHKICMSIVSSLWSRDFLSTFFLLVTLGQNGQWVLVKWDILSSSTKQNDMHDGQNGQWFLIKLNILC